MPRFQPIRLIVCRTGGGSFHSIAIEIAQSVHFICQTRGMNVLAIQTGRGKNGPVLVTVPNADLAEIMASSVLLSRMWPSACQEVGMLIHVLRISDPSLADALTTGLISVVTPPSGKPSAEISLAHKSAVLSAIARREAGGRVTAPHNRPSQIRWLEVIDLAVAGHSAMRGTG